MAIVGNKATEIGDIIRIETDVPVIGIVSLLNFADDTDNETGTRYFNKEFRYSTDGGMNFTAWADLTLINVQEITLTRKDQLMLEYKYERVGSDSSDFISVNDVNVWGDFSDLPYPVYQRNVFNRFFDVNNPEVLGWALNVLEKMYQRGIVPDYIERNDDEENPIVVDVDFLAFFYSFTHFFAIIVYYSRKYVDIKNTDLLLNAFIERIGLFTRTNPTDKHLKYLFDNYTEEFKKRGTSAILDFNNDEDTPDGELLRLINYGEHDELMLALLEPHATGWCISKSSPMVNTTRQCVNMIKGYEKSEKFLSKDNYPISPDDTAIDLTEDLITIKRNSNTGVINGIYPVGGIGGFDANKAIKIDPAQDYEITVRLSTENLVESLYFGCFFYTKTGHYSAPYNLKEKDYKPFFFEGQKLYRADKDYFISGILFNNTTSLDAGDDKEMGLNIGFGSHLRLNGDVEYAMPFLYTYSDVAATQFVYIKEFKMRPINFNFSLGKLGLKNIMYMLYKNNSLFKDDYIYRNTDQKLIPFDVALIDKSLEPKDDGTGKPIEYNFGYLYNHHTIDTGKLAPAGWRVPILADITELLSYTGSTGLNMGGKLKEEGLEFWRDPNAGATDEFGFSGRPSGSRDGDAGGTGQFRDVFNNFTFWSNSIGENAGEFWLWRMSYSNEGLWPGSDGGSYGHAIRLIKDDDVDPGTLTDIDGNEYETVKIGNQVWMKENLKVTKYNDGEVIPVIEDDDTWKVASAGAICAYYNDEKYL